MRNLIIALFLFISIIKSEGQTYTKSLYVEHFPQNILGDVDREDALLQYAKDRGYTSLILYSIQQIFPIKYELPNPATTQFARETELRDFIQKAKNPPYNLTEIGVTEGANWDDAHKQPNIVYTIPLSLLTPTGTFTSLGTGDDIISSQINLPFAFNDLDGNPVTKIFASTNGFIELETLQPCSSCITAQYIPNPNVNNPRNIIAGYWDDLNVKTTSVFRYFTNGTVGNRIFVIEWKDVEFKNGGNNGNASFQIQIFELDKHFEIHIATGSENPVLTKVQTIGISNSTGTIAAAAKDQEPTLYKIRHYPRFSNYPQAWKFVPGEAHDWMDKNVYWYNLRHPAEKIDLISLEFEFWNLNPTVRWEAVQYFQRQLNTTYNIKTAAAAPQKYTILPYLHAISEVSWLNDYTTAILNSQSQVDFIVSIRLSTSCETLFHNQPL